MKGLGRGSNGLQGEKIAFAHTTSIWNLSQFCGVLQ